MKDFRHIRTGITHMVGAFNAWERCNKHKKVWKEGEPDPEKCCMECINKSHRDKRYKL